MRQELKEKIDKILGETSKACTVSPAVRKLHVLIEELRQEVEHADHDREILQKIHNLLQTDMAGLIYGPGPS